MPVEQRSYRRLVAVGILLSIGATQLYAGNETSPLIFLSPKAMWQKGIKPVCIRFLKSDACKNIEFGCLGFCIGSVIGALGNVGKKTEQYSLMFDMCLGGLAFGMFGFMGSDQWHYMRRVNVRLKALNERLRHMVDDIGKMTTYSQQLEDKLKDLGARLVQINMMQQETLSSLSQKEKNFKGLLTDFEKKMIDDNLKYLGEIQQITQRINH
jgi:hypothetical protein